MRVACAQSHLGGDLMRVLGTNVCRIFEAGPRVVLLR